MYHSMISSQQILFIFLLYAPAMVANMAPVLASKYNILMWLNKAIDLGITLRGKRLLGDNKTLRGFIVGVLSAASVGWLVSLFTRMSPYDSFAHAITFGAATGLGALVGDSVESFCKRRLNIKPGELWIPFDQIDFVIGATLVAIFFVPISFSIFIFAIIFIGLLSYVVSKIGFALHIKKNL
jgi:CDP-2,3-bis-(O-geranylgeranyl)-sn-glycerol synthase